MYSKETTPSRCLNSLCRISDIAARQRCLFSFFLSKYLLPQEFQPSLSWDLYFQKAIIRDLRLSRVIRILVHSLKTKQTNKNKAPRAFLRPPQLEKFKAPQLKQHGGSDSVNIRDAIVFSGGLRLQFIKCGSLFFFSFFFCTACQDRLWQRFDTRAICHIGVFSTKCVGSSKQWEWID